jgi:hypothetical protein
VPTCRKHVGAFFNGWLTVTSTFLLTLQLEWALTIFLTVARGYIFWPGAILLCCPCAKMADLGEDVRNAGWLEVGSMLLLHAVRAPGC